MAAAGIEDKCYEPTDESAGELSAGCSVSRRKQQGSQADRHCRATVSGVGRRATDAGVGRRATVAGVGFLRVFPVNLLFHPFDMSSSKARNANFSADLDLLPDALSIAARFIRYAIQINSAVATISGGVITERIQRCFTSVEIAVSLSVPRIPCQLHIGNCGISNLCRTLCRLSFSVLTFHIFRLRCDSVWRIPSNVISLHAMSRNAFHIAFCAARHMPLYVCKLRGTLLFGRGIHSRDLS